MGYVIRIQVPADLDVSFETYREGDDGAVHLVPAAAPVGAVPPLRSKWTPSDQPRASEVVNEAGERELNVLRFVVNRRPERFYLHIVAAQVGEANHYVVSGLLSALSRRCYERGRDIMWRYEEQDNGRCLVWMEEPAGTLFEQALQEAGS